MSEIERVLISPGPLVVSLLIVVVGLVSLYGLWLTGIPEVQQRLSRHRMIFVVLSVVVVALGAAKQFGA